MNSDTIIGFVLIALVLIGFSWWSQPSQEEIDAYQRQQDSIAAVERDKEMKQKNRLHLIPLPRATQQPSSTLPSTAPPRTSC